MTDNFTTAYIDFALDALNIRSDLLPDNPEKLFGDGATYSDSIQWQSPEGNFYGQRKIVKEYYIPVLWDGENYRKIYIIGTVASVVDLPLGHHRAFDCWTVTSRNSNGLSLDAVAYYYYPETEEWRQVEWFHNVLSKSELPFPGRKIGAAHYIVLRGVEVMWNGYRWAIHPSHSTILDDEPDRHLTDFFITNYENYQTSTNGAIQFLQSQQAEARLEFLSKTTLGLLSSVVGKTGAIWVNNELLLTDDISNVENTDSVLQYSNGTIINDTVDPNVEYYVYCGNSDFTACSSGLFLSQTPDINGRLGDELPGLNARIVGVVEADSAGYFVREIDMSYIGKKVEFSQTFWEYSDFQLQFVDEDNLAFNRIDGTHGLVYINGQLLYLGTGRDINRADYRIEWNDGPDIDTSSLSASTVYQIYIANDSVEFNFNNEDGETGLPYEEGHEDYIEQLDFRRQMFLSTQPHDHRVFNQEYPGYYARHIGQVQTDENGLFRYSADISLIRQPTLNPTHLDGLAECVIQDVSTTQFKVIRKKGTTGIVYVGGKPVQTYDADNPLVHIVTTSDTLYEYDETEIDAPLTDSGLNVADKPGISIYLYLANDIDAWGSVTTFCSLEAPHGGYLSTNWPGNQARWIATIQLAPATLGSEKVTNGAFTSDTSWTKGTNWAYSAPNQNMVHTPGNAATLAQDVSAVAGELYACTFYITGRTAGIAAPRVGGTSGLSISGNTSSTQYLLASTTGNLEIVPDTYFDGSVDNVSVKKVVTGQFSGTYIKDSVSGVSAQIDDSIVSTATTYSSNKIEQIRQQLLSKINLALGLNGSHTAGLDLQLEYINSTTIRLKAISADVDIIFPNLDVVTITTTGITKTVSGSTGTIYYVYLTTAGVLEISTNAPTDVYSSISFYGETNVLVGYLSCSSINTIAGTQNVYSYWNEPTRTYTTPVVSGTTTLTVPSLLIPTGKTATVSRTGSTTVAGSLYGNNGATGPLGSTSASVVTGSASGTDYDFNNPFNAYAVSCGCAGGPEYVLQITVSAALSTTTLSAGIHNSVTFTQSITSSYGSTALTPPPASECYGITSLFGVMLVSTSYTSITGDLIITRPGS